MLLSRISYELAETDPRMRGRATTVNIGTIRGGDCPSTVPSSCVIECRIGFPPGETNEDVMKQVEAAVRNVAEEDSWLRKNPPAVEWFGWKARPHELDPTNEFVQLVRSSVIEVTGHEPAFIGGSAGFDARHFVHNGTPAVTCGPHAEGIHSFDEAVSIESTLLVSQIIAKTIVDWCENS